MSALAHIPALMLLLVPTFDAFAIAFSGVDTAFVAATVVVAVVVGGGGGDVTGGSSDSLDFNCLSVDVDTGITAVCVAFVFFEISGTDTVAVEEEKKFGGGKNTRIFVVIC